MKRSFFSSLIFKIGIVIVILEAVVLTSFGIYCTRRFEEEVDDRVYSRVGIPGNLMAKGMLEYSVVQNQDQMREMVGDNLDEAMIVTVTQKVFYSLKAEYEGKNISEVPGLSADWFSPSVNEVSIQYVLEKGGNYVICITPIFAGESKKPYYFLYLKMSTNDAELEKKSIGNIFLTGTIACLVFTSLLILLLFRIIISKRLSLTLDGIRRIEEGNFASSRIQPISSNDEISHLQRGINSMAGTLQDSFASLEGEIVNRKQAEDELEKKLSQLRVLIDNIPDLIYFKDADSRFVLVNTSQLRVLGAQNEEEVIGKTNFDFYPKDLARKYSADEREIIRTGKPQISQEEPIIDKNGNRLWLSTTMVPLKDPSGKVTGLVGICRDITEHKVLDDKLKDLAKFPDENPNPVLRISADGRLLHANASSGPLLSTWGCAVGGRLPEGWRSLIKETIASGSKRELQEEFAGSTFQMMMVPFVASGYVNLYGYDITQLTLLEAQLVQAQKMEAIGRLAGGVAHDFNNMMTVVNGFSDVLLNRIKGSDPLRAHVEKIKEAGTRAAALTDQLLAFGRKKVIQTKVLNLNEVIARLGKMLQRPIGEDIELTFLPDQELGLIMIDPTQIDQILMNLVINARDAMPQGGKITIETGNVDLDENYACDHAEVKPGPYVRLTVSDTGTGMDKETQSKIFEPFFTTKAEGKGTGLGLPTVYGIVEQAEGKIWVYSEPGKGTTFKIYLPRVQDTTVSAEKDRRSSVSPTGTETILLVEDEDLVRDLACGALVEKGYTVLEAKNGEEALRLSTSHEGVIHLVLTDVVMPGMSGPVLIGHLKRRRPTMKVIYMSGYTDNAIVHHGVLEPGLEFLQKPFSPDSLVGKVREVLDASAERNINL